MTRAARTHVRSSAHARTWSDLGRAVALALGLGLGTGLLAPSRAHAAPQPHPPVPSDDPAARMRNDPDEQAAEHQFDEWQFAEGRRLLGALQAKRPDAPETLYLDGYARFLPARYSPPGVRSRLFGASARVCRYSA